MSMDSLHTSLPPESEAGSLVYTARVAVVMIAVAVTILLLQQLRSVMSPLVLGLLVFNTLDPLVDWMERRAVPRAVGAAIALTLTMGSLGTLAYLLQDQAMTVVRQLPEGARKIASMLERRPADPPGPLACTQTTPGRSFAGPWPSSRW